MTAQVLHRTTTSHEDDEIFHFASVDGGETWVELEREPTRDDYEGIVKLLAGTIDSDGMKHGVMTCTRRYFSIMSPVFTVGEAKVAK